MEQISVETCAADVSDEILSRLQEYLEIQEDYPGVLVVIDWLDGNLK